MQKGSTATYYRLQLRRCRILPQPDDRFAISLALGDGWDKGQNASKTGWETRTIHSSWCRLETLEDVLVHTRYDLAVLDQSVKPLSEIAQSFHYGTYA